MNSPLSLDRPSEGFLIVDKPVGVTSFDIVARVRKILDVKCVGHAGTLDPFASGILIILVGRNFTRRSSELMLCKKRYKSQVLLGISTDSHDLTGKITSRSDFRPSIQEIKSALCAYQGEIEQTPPMFSAKSINGTRLYKLARKGQLVERQRVSVYMQVQLVEYAYPHLDLRVLSGKGAYIRALARDLGQALGCGAHLKSLIREKSGDFDLHNCFDGNRLFEKSDQTLKASLQQALIYC